MTPNEALSFEVRRHLAEQPRRPFDRAAVVYTVLGMLMGLILLAVFLHLASGQGLRLSEAAQPLDLVEMRGRSCK